MSQPFVAVKPISVVGAQYCVPYRVDFTFARNSTNITGGNFAIFDAIGDLMFKVKSALFSLHDRRVLLDRAGNPLLCMRQKILTLHRRLEVYRGDSSDCEKDLLFSVKKSSMLQCRTELQVFIASNTNENVCDFMIKGSLLERSCIVYLGESTNILAQMQEKKDTFMVTVIPQIDYTFMVALIVIFIKIDEDRNAANEINTFTFAEVSKHNNLEDCWLLINDKVYDVTNFLRDHPGDSKVLLKASGKDATIDFLKAHSHSSNAVAMMDKFNVGVCDPITGLLSQLANDKPQVYSRVQLTEFTNDFSQLLGSGGFGNVYKGRFPHGVFIAVKVLKIREHMDKEKVKDMEDQFKAEVDTMSRAHHQNLIKLHGYCYERNTKFKALVYDYMENGSFDKILFKKKLDIPWAKLHNIAKEIAQGISYLHEGCNPRIIHQDIKPANVLIDTNLSPKVIDFGLAKVINNGESQFEQSKVKGSRGYMAPEVNQYPKIKLSSKLDVYSFGMMLFDILGSRRNYVDKRWFPGQVWKMYKAGQLEKFILDCGIKEEDKKNAERLATIALLCVQHNPRTRPKLSTVVKLLEGEIIQLETPIIPFSRDYVAESCSTSDTRDY